MKLYHGTNGRWLKNILQRGIEPRGARPGRNNWKHVPHQSNPKCVYLTDSYAPYFSFNATKGGDPRCGVIEIDTDRLKTWLAFHIEYKPRPDLTLRAEFDNADARGFEQIREYFPGPRDLNGDPVIDTRNLHYGRLFYIRARKTFG